MSAQKNKKSYQARYGIVIKNLHQISQMQPQEKYMVRLMDTVIFQDFETALETIIEDFQIANDNKK